MQTHQQSNQLSKLRRLEQLALSHNDLAALPPTLARLRHLQQLYAHHNRISQLPTSFGRLRPLTVLNLGYNWITVVPPTLASLPAPTELDLSNNNIQEFPSVLQAIKTLERVYPGSNPLFGSDAMSSRYAPGSAATGPADGGVFTELCSRAVRGRLHTPGW